jgi:hypothetical protein
MSLNGIQNGTQTSAEFYGMNFSSSSRTGGGCNNNSGICFNEQQLKDIVDRLSQAFKANESGASNTPSPQNSNATNGESESSNEIKGLLEKLVNLLKSFMEKTGGENQTKNAAPKEGGNFLEKLLTAPLELAKTFAGGLLGGGEGGGLLGGLLGGGKEGGGLFGGLLGGIFGGNK